MPLGDGILLGLSRMNRILEVDLENRCAVVQPGVTNLAITRAVEADGFYYAPDPSSQIACTIGGNVAENSGGIHCLKYGLTTNNLLGVELALIDGTRVRFGGKAMDAGGLDLLGLVTGSEGLLGVVTEVTVRLRPKPPTAKAMLIAFPSTEAAGQCVADVIAAGIIPAAMEIMDRFAMDAIEAYCAPGYPREAAAILIAEVDGMEVEVAATIGRDRSHRAQERRPLLRKQHRRRRTRTHLAGPQSRFRRRRPDRTRHVVHGRHDPAPHDARGVETHRANVVGISDFPSPTSSTPATEIFIPSSCST